MQYVAYHMDRWEQMKGQRMSRKRPASDLLAKIDVLVQALYEMQQRIYDLIGNEFTASQEVVRTQTRALLLSGDQHI